VNSLHNTVVAAVYHYSVCIRIEGIRECQCQPTVNHSRYYIVNKQKKQPNFWVWAWCLRIEAHRKYGCTEPKPDCPPPAWLQRNKEKDCGWTWGSSELLPQGRHRKCCLPALGSIYALVSLFYLLGYSWRRSPTVGGLLIWVSRSQLPPPTIPL
jgi:hypothetical protein